MPKILDHHLEDLQASGLSDETIKELGFYSGTAEEVRAILGFNAGRGMVMPYPAHRDATAFFRIKPDDPPEIDGKRPKYLSPKGSGLRAYIPPKSWDALSTPKARVLITEGEKKAAAADQEGFPCVGLGGIYGFRDREHVFLQDLEEPDWSNRDVAIVPDSDVATNQGVRDAVWELGSQLLQRRANPLVVVLQAPEDGSKLGLDDFLVARGREEFAELLSQAEPLAEWACGFVAALLPARRSEGLEWLAPRLKSLGPVEVEIILASMAHRLGIKQSTLQNLVKKARRWTPSPPRAQREEAAEHERRQRSEAKAQEESAGRADADLEARALLLLDDPAILHRAITAVEALGVVGERRNVGLILLAMRSRASSRPANLEVNSPSSAGKTHLIVNTLRLEHPDAFYELTAGSERALIYLDESLKNRVLYVQEPEGLSEGVGAAALKSLIWEGRLKYDTVVKEEGKFVSQHVEKEGPTGLIVTTTRPLDEQLSNRMLRIEVDTSEEQTRRVLSQIAAEATGARPNAELALWHAVSKLAGDPVEVVVPFATWLAEHMATVTLRIRRDFTQLLSLVKASAIAHRFQRREAGPGLLTATVADYAVVHSLAAEVFKAAQAEGVTDADREFVNAVEEASDHGENTASQANLVSHLGTSKATVSYRVRRLLRLGYLTNLEDRKGRPHRLIPGVPLPELVPPLPTPCDLARHLLEAGQEPLVQPWVDPVSGDRHDCAAHASSPGEQVNTGLSAPSPSRSEVFIRDVNGGEHPNAKGEAVHPFTGVHPPYEQSVRPDDKRWSEERSGVQPEELWEEVL